MSSYYDEERRLREELKRMQEETDAVIRDIKRDHKRFMDELYAESPSYKDNDEETWLESGLKSVGKSLWNAVQKNAINAKKRRNARYESIDRDMRTWEREDLQFQKEIKSLEDDLNDSW